MDEGCSKESITYKKRRLDVDHPPIVRENVVKGKPVLTTHLKVRVIVGWGQLHSALATQFA